MVSSNETSIFFLKVFKSEENACTCESCVSEERRLKEMPVVIADSVDVKSPELMVSEGHVT